MKMSGKHLLVLVSLCGLIASGIGLVTNVSGLFFTPIADEFGILKGSASLMLTICNIALAIGGMIVPHLLSEKSLKPLLIGSTAVLAGSTAALSVCPSIPPMYVLSALRGFAAVLQDAGWLRRSCRQGFLPLHEAYERGQGRAGLAARPAWWPRYLVAALLALGGNHAYGNNQKSGAAAR